MPSVSIIPYYLTLHDAASQGPAMPYAFMYARLLAGQPLKHHRWAVDWAQLWLQTLNTWEEEE